VLADPAVVVVVELVEEPLLEALHRHAGVGRAFPHQPRNHVDRHARPRRWQECCLPLKPLAVAVAAGFILVLLLTADPCGDEMRKKTGIL